MIQLNSVLTAESISAKFRWNILFTVLASFILIYSCLGSLQKLLLHRTIYHAYFDFGVLYQAARAVGSGANLYQSASHYIYPPLLACVLEPLSRLNWFPASLIWLGITIALIVIILVVGFRTLSSAFKLNCHLADSLAICSLALLLSYNQVRSVIRSGECDAVSLAGIAVGLYWLRRRPSLAGALLGMTVLIKYQSICFLPLLLLRGRWRAALAMIAGIIAAALLPALWVGWERNLEYLTMAFHGLMMTETTLLSPAIRLPPLDWWMNISITNGLVRAFQGHDLPVSDALIMASTIAFLTFLFLWWIFQSYGVPLLWRTPATLQNPKKESAIFYLECAALLTAMLAFSPQLLNRHLFILLNVQLLAGLLLLLPTQNVKRWPLILVFAIELVPLANFFPWSLEWKHIGGPGWALLLFLIVMIWNGLAYYRDKLSKLPALHC
jgi:hypothetical protein